MKVPVKLMILCILCMAGKGHFKLYSGTRIPVTAGSDEIHRTGQFLSDKISAATGWPVPINVRGPGEIMQNAIVPINAVYSMWNCGATAAPIPTALYESPKRIKYCRGDP